MNVLSDLWNIAGKGLRELGDAVGGIFVKNDPAAAEGAGAAPPPASPRPAPRLAAARAGKGAGAAGAAPPLAAARARAGAGAIVSADIVRPTSGPSVGLEPVFKRSILRVGKKIDYELKKISSQEEDMGKRAANVVSGGIGLAGALGGGVASTALSVIPGLAGEFENFFDTQEERNDQSVDPVDRNNKHLVSTYLEKVVVGSFNVLEGPSKTMSELIDPVKDDKVKVLVENAQEMRKQVGDVLHSTVAVGAGIFGVDLAEEEAERKAEEARKIAEEVIKVAAPDPAPATGPAPATDPAPAPAPAPAVVKPDKINIQKEFESLFFNAKNIQEYENGYVKQGSILMKSNFNINQSIPVNSVTFFENVKVESRERGYIWGTKEKSSNEGNKEVVFVGDEAYKAQNKMFKEYFENAKKILELKAKVDKYNANKSGDDKIELGDLCDIKEQKDFNFLIKDINDKNIVNSPLQQRIDKINKKINGIDLPKLDKSESDIIEKKANEYAKILLAAQVKNNCLYTEDGDEYKEAKRINIFRGKKDFKTGKSVTEVKFGSSCQEGDFALIPVNKNLELFCKVSYESNADAKIEYFIKKDNDLKLIKYNKEVYLYGSNLKFDDDDSDVPNKKEIIKEIENHKIEVSWSAKIVNSTKQLDEDMPSAGGDNNKGSITPDDDDDGIKSFGSQSFVIERQVEYRLKSRNTADWWNDKTKISWIEGFKTKHSQTGFSIKENTRRLFSTGNLFTSTFLKHNRDEDGRGIKKILASEFEIDVQIDSSGKITSKNSYIDSEKNPKLTNALQILNKLKFDDNGNLKAGFTTDSTYGVQSRFFRKSKFIGGEVKQGGSMVVNMNVVNENGVKSRIRVEFGVENMKPGLITTGDNLVIKSVSKIDKDREKKWVESITEGSDTKATAR